MSNTCSLKNVERLLWVMERLRSPDGGCPWDREQTFETIVPYTIEEAYEVADAIEKGDMDEIKDELGDLLFQVVFYAQMGKEQSEFDFDGVASAIADKLIRRHPHVFADATDTSEQALSANWEAIKQQERAEKGQDEDASVLANVPAGMAPLMRAVKLQKRCAKVGFDWPEASHVVDKIHEEIEEVMAEARQKQPDQAAVEDEIGDLLFAVVNLSRHLQVDPETALRKANRKFEARFRGVEAIVAKHHAVISDATLEEMEAAWQCIKDAERKNSAS